MKKEFRKIIKDTLVEYSYDNDAQAINLTSEVSQDLLSEAIEERLKSKFYVFRRNRLCTGDAKAPEHRHEQHKHEYGETPEQKTLNENEKEKS